ncbi:GTP-binding protein Rho1 [Cladochytrium tenue]|nr:GTP-binding protein Rho1 [Cladochytrium tenue]
MRTAESDVIVDVSIGDGIVSLSLWAQGHDFYSYVRKLMYLGTDAIILCFSVADPWVLEEVEERWMPELHHFCPGAPVLLVGCKTDLRHDPAIAAELARQNLHSGTETARRLGLHSYSECSEMHRDGFADLLTHAARAAVLSPARAIAAALAAAKVRSKRLMRCSRRCLLM